MKHDYTVARNTFLSKTNKKHTHTKFIVVLMLLMIKLVEPINELPQYLD
jgi:hypothetical protein